MFTRTALCDLLLEAPDEKINTVVFITSNADAQIIIQITKMTRS